MLQGIFTLSLFIASQNVAKTTLLPDCLRYSIQGDINIGGIFSFYVNSELPCQEGLAPRGIFMAESMRFAIEEINNRTDLLPNVTLGFDIVDDGWSEDIALRNTLNLVNDYSMDKVCTNETSEAPSNSGIVGIIGTSRSATTIPSTRLAALFNIPIISYYASSVELTDKSQFPYFLRTVPPDGLQVGAIVDLLELYNWNYIGVIHSIDSYGIHGARQLQTLVEIRGICVAFIAPVSDSATEKELHEVVSKFHEYPMAKTVVMFSSGKVANTVLEQMKLEEFSTEITWIGSDDWGYDLKEKGFEHLTTGAIFTRFYSISVPEYEQYIAKLDFDDPLLSPWYRAYWRHRATLSNCTDVNVCDSFLEDDFSAIYITLPVIDAVYVFAHGLHSLMTEKCGDDDLCQGFPESITGDELLEHLRDVDFEAKSGHFIFDANADPPGKYILRNWQIVDGEHRFVDVGLWDSAKATDKLTIDTNNVKFQSGSNVIPKSTCRVDCGLGSIVIPLEQKCCWGCQPCAVNAIVVNATRCRECPRAHWPNNNYTSCHPILPTNLSWVDPIVLAMVIISTLGIILCSVTLIGMGWYGDQPIIKACSRELSAINVFGIFMSFICSFILVLPPNVTTCMAVEAVISMCFTLTYAPTLLKVNRIYRIFKAGKKSVKRPKMVGPREQLFIVFAVILIEVVIVVIGSILDPGVPVTLIPSKTEPYVEKFCNFGYGFLAACIYNALLVLSCCYYAFRTRTVPDNYNESKFIAISVYSTLVVTLSVVPVYSTANSALYKVAVLCLALLVNAYLNLFCVYLIKLYAVRFLDPEEAPPRTMTFQHNNNVGATRNRVVPAISQSVHENSTVSASNTNSGDGTI